MEIQQEIKVKDCCKRAKGGRRPAAPIGYLGWPAEVGAAASCTDGTFGLAGKNDKYTIRILYISFYYSFTYKTLYKYEVFGGNQKISIGFGRKSKDFNRFWEEIARRSESSGVGN